MSSDIAPVTVGRPETGIVRIGLNRPEKRNALDPGLRGALIEALAGALDDASVHAVILAGNGGHFCAGGDIASMAGLDAPAGRARMRLNHRLVRLIADAEKPVVAAIEGYAVGAGAGLALLADTMVLAETGAIGFPFFKVGLIPDYGILFSLPQRVGQARARRILLNAEMLRGADALAAGLADEIAPEGEAEAAALIRARTLAAMPPFAFALCKQQLRLAPQSLDAALEQEALAQASCFTTDDFAEGRAAFAAKRPPVFRGQEGRRA